MTLAIAVLLVAALVAVRFAYKRGFKRGVRIVRRQHLRVYRRVQ